MRSAFTVLQRKNIPQAIRSLSPMTPDYIDLFTLTTSQVVGKSPETWARALVEGAAGLGGQFVWRVALGLRLKSGSSPHRVGGWNVADQGDDWIRLEAASWFLTAHIVMQVRADQVSAATFIRYDRPVAAFIWRQVSILHRQAMPGLLRRAAGSQS